MHSETVTPEALALLTALMQEPLLKEYRLVGGTALSLLRGHRISVDLDLFVLAKEQSSKLAPLLEDRYQATNMRVGDDSAVISGVIQSIKVDFIAYPYAWLSDMVMGGNIRIAALQDIAAMKISAIGQRGRKKDFFDLAELLSVYSLEQIMDFFQKKYPSASDFHYLQALTYFEDAENDPEPCKTAQSLSWIEVRERISCATHEMMS